MAPVGNHSSHHIESSAGLLVSWHLSFIPRLVVQLLISSFFVIILISRSSSAILLSFLTTGTDVMRGGTYEHP